MIAVYPWVKTRWIASSTDGLFAAFFFPIGITFWIFATSLLLRAIPGNTREVLFSPRYFYASIISVST